MSLYQQEFGQDFDLGFDLKNHPYLIDKSWHNDQCPSFYFKVDEQYYVLWVDYAAEERREDGTPRYMITKGVNEGTNENLEIYAGNAEVLIESEDYTELNLFLKAMQNNKSPH